MDISELTKDLIKVAIAFTPLSGAISFYHFLKKHINGPNKLPSGVKV